MFLLEEQPSSFQSPTQPGTPPWVVSRSHHMPAGSQSNELAQGGELRARQVYQQHTRGRRPASSGAIRRAHQDWIERSSIPKPFWSPSTSADGYVKCSFQRQAAPHSTGSVLCRPDWDPVFNEGGRMVATNQKTYRRPMSAGRIPKAHVDPASRTAPNSPGPVLSEASRGWCDRASLPKAWYVSMMELKSFHRGPDGQIASPVAEAPGAAERRAGGAKATASEGFYHRLAVPKSYFVNGKLVHFTAKDDGAVTVQVPAEVRSLVTIAKAR